MLAAGTSSTVDAIFWSFVLLAGILVIGVAVFALRRWLFASQAQNAEPPWSLQHLRGLHARGQISDEEFQRLKAQMLGEVGRTRNQSAGRGT